MAHEPSSPTFAIGKLSRESGVKIETIRYYERIGLLAEPPRSAGGYRQYASQHLDALIFIRRARELGFPLAEIHTLFELANDRFHCKDVQAIAQQQIRLLESKITDLKRLRDSLSAMEKNCQGGTVTACPVIAALRG